MIVGTPVSLRHAAFENGFRPSDRRFVACTSLVCLLHFLQVRVPYSS